MIYKHIYVEIWTDRHIDFCLEPKGTPHLTHTVDLFVRYDANNADIVQGCFKLVCLSYSLALPCLMPVSLYCPHQTLFVTDIDWTG